MPAIAHTQDANTSASQLIQTLDTFTALQDPLAISDALLVFAHAIQRSQNTETQQTILNTVPLTHFFQLLERDFGYDTEQVIDRTCTVIEGLLRDQSYNTIAQDPLLSQALVQALHSPSPRVFGLGLSQVDKLASGNSGDLNRFLESGVFSHVLAGLTNTESIAIAERSKQTLLEVCGTQDRLEIVLNHTQSLSSLRELVNSRNAIVQLRAVEAMTELAGKSPEMVADLDRAGLLAPLMTGLDASDILSRFNIIEILTKFGATAAGSEYLDQAGILTRLSSVVQDETTEDRMGVNAIIKLYGQLGASEQVEFVTLDMKYQILSQLERLLVGDDAYEPDESLRTEAIASFGLIGGNIQNVEWVSQSPSAVSFIDLLSTLTRDAKVTWYHALAQILACSSDTLPETDRIVSEFYNRLEGPSQSPFVSRLLASAKSQTVDLAMAAMSVMIPLARYPFGVKKMAEVKELITFLLDRNVELTHAGKVARAEVIEAMLATAQNASTSTGQEL
ncbi:26S proteasome non-ATPase regulatory subunit 5, partial [Podila epigama]